jgi:hypothetical protein
VKGPKSDGVNDFVTDDCAIRILISFSDIDGARDSKVELVTDTLQ